eukprot:3923020-Prymnesium_polylepis.1
MSDRRPCIASGPLTPSGVGSADAVASADWRAPCQAVPSASPAPFSSAARASNGTAPASLLQMRRVAFSTACIARSSAAGERAALTLSAASCTVLRSSRPARCDSATVARPACSSRASARLRRAARALSACRVAASQISPRLWLRRLSACLSARRLRDRALTLSSAMQP